MIETFQNTSVATVKTIVATIYFATINVDCCSTGYDDDTERTVYFLSSTTVIVSIYQLKINNKRAQVHVAQFLLTKSSFAKTGPVGAMIRRDSKDISKKMKRTLLLQSTEEHDFVYKAITADAQIAAPASILFVNFAKLKLLHYTLLVTYGVLAIFLSSAGYKYR